MASTSSDGGSAQVTPLLDNTTAQVQVCFTTTSVLNDFTDDELWLIQWSQSGKYLACGGRGEKITIWAVSMNTDTDTTTTESEWLIYKTLKVGGSSNVDCLTWSQDDKLLLSASNNQIQLWDVESGECLDVLSEHNDLVTSLVWLPDDSGFISGASDCRIIHWTVDGTMHDCWEETGIRIVDLAISPDLKWLIAVGPKSFGKGESRDYPSKMVIYNFSTRQVEFAIESNDPKSIVKISKDSRYAIVSCGEELQLWYIAIKQIIRKFTGHKMSRHVISVAFGGLHDQIVATGSEDGKVYVWDRNSGELLAKLEGHGEGIVNSIAFNPTKELEFATCSEDKTVRIWRGENL